MVNKTNKLYCDDNKFLSNLDNLYKDELEFNKSCDCVKAFIKKHPLLSKEKNCTCENCFEKEKGYPYCECNPWDV